MLLLLRLEIWSQTVQSLLPIKFLFTIWWLNLYGTLKISSYYIQQKSVEEIAELDKDDEALVKYKQALLGDAVGKWVQSAYIAVFVNWRP